MPPDPKDNSEVKDSSDFPALEATAVCLVVLVSLGSLVELDLLGPLVPVDPLVTSACLV